MLAKKSVFGLIYSRSVEHLNVKGKIGKEKKV